MIFNSKQLEELENIHDSTGVFEEEADDEGFGDDVGEAAMDWRRSLIEEAAENIKRAKTRPLEPHIQYNIGSMLFDREARRFARVQRSVPGYLKIAYLSGGDREFGSLDLTGYLKEYGAQKRLSELSMQLGLTDIEVSHELDRLGITPLEELETEEQPEEAEQLEDPVAPPIPPFAKAKPPRPAFEDEEEEEEQPPPALVAPAKPAPKPAAIPKPPAKPPATVKPASKAAPPKAAAAPAKQAMKAAKPQAGKANPIDDPNGFIKANYESMSNRELARLTGLSEHTIRRKLGEWGLKRKKEL